MHIISHRVYFNEVLNAGKFLYVFNARTYLRVCFLLRLTDSIYTIFPTINMMAKQLKGIRFLRIQIFIINNVLSFEEPTVSTLIIKILDVTKISFILVYHDLRFSTIEHLFN